MAVNVLIEEEARKNRPVSSSSVKPANPPPPVSPQPSSNPQKSPIVYTPIQRGNISAIQIDDPILTGYTPPEGYTVKSFTKQDDKISIELMPDPKYLIQQGFREEGGEYVASHLPPAYVNFASEYGLTIGQGSKYYRTSTGEEVREFRISPEGKITMILASPEKPDTGLDLSEYSYRGFMNVEGAGSIGTDPVITTNTEAMGRSTMLLGLSPQILKMSEGIPKGEKILSSSFIDVEGAGSIATDPIITGQTPVYSGEVLKGTVNFMAGLVSWGESLAGVKTVPTFGSTAEKYQGYTFGSLLPDIIGGAFLVEQAPRAYSYLKDFVKGRFSRADVLSDVVDLDLRGIKNFERDPTPEELRKLTKIADSINQPYQSSYRSVVQKTSTSDDVLDLRGIKNFERDPTTDEFNRLTKIAEKSDQSVYSARTNKSPAQNDISDLFKGDQLYPLQKGGGKSQVNQLSFEWDKIDFKTKSLVDSNIDDMVRTTRVRSGEGTLELIVKERTKKLSIDPELDLLFKKNTRRPTLIQDLDVLSHSKLKIGFTTLTSLDILAKERLRTLSIEEALLEEKLKTRSVSLLKLQSSIITEQKKRGGLGFFSIQDEIIKNDEAQDPVTIITPIDAVIQKQDRDVIVIHKPLTKFDEVLDKPFRPKRTSHKDASTGVGFKKGFWAPGYRVKKEKLKTKDLFKIGGWTG